MKTDNTFTTCLHHWGCVARMYGSDANIVPLAGEASHGASWCIGGAAIDFPVDFSIATELSRSTVLMGTL